MNTVGPAPPQPQYLWEETVAGLDHLRAPVGHTNPMRDGMGPARGPPPPVRAQKGHVNLVGERVGPAQPGGPPTVQGNNKAQGGGQLAEPQHRPMPPPKAHPAAGGLARVAREGKNQLQGCETAQGRLSQPSPHGTSSVTRHAWRGWHEG